MSKPLLQRFCFNVSSGHQPAQYWLQIQDTNSADHETCRHGSLYQLWWKFGWSDYFMVISNPYFDGLEHDCSISSANALEILQSCTKPSINPSCAEHIWGNIYLYFQSFRDTEMAQIREFLPFGHQGCMHPTWRCSHGTDVLLDNIGKCTS